MAEQKKPTPTTATKPATAKSTISFKNSTPQPEKRVVFERENYYLFFLGIAFIVIGYLCMAGGKSNDPNTFNADEIYAWRRINLAPTLVLLGFGIEIIAIMYRKKKKAQ